MIGIRFDQPFQEQLDFFRQKGFALSPESWRDVWRDAHARAFTVARVTAMDALQDIRGALDEAMANGVPLTQFKTGLRETLTRKGWFAPEGEKARVLMPDGTVRKRLTGWRLDTIFQTNCAAAYSVGRYKQQQEVKVLRPYWRYMTDEGPNVRPSHAAHHGKVYHAEHPFWDAWYPPNGFNCHCYVRTLSDRQMKQKGLTEEKRGTQAKPDEGFDYNPGKAGLAAWKPDLAKFPASVRKIIQEDIADAFVPAKSIKEAEAWARKKDLANIVDYKGLDLEVANTFNARLQDTLKRFPKLRANMEFVGTIQARNKYLQEKVFYPEIRKSLEQSPGGVRDVEKTARAWAKKRAERWGYGRARSNIYAESTRLEGVKGVAVNEKFGKDAAQLMKLLARDVQLKWHPEGGGTIRGLLDHEFGHQIDDLLQVRTDPDFRRVYNAEAGKGMEHVMNGLSQYAFRGGVKEYIAEGWSEYLNNPQPRELARFVGVTIEAKYDAIR